MKTFCSSCTITPPRSNSEIFRLWTENSSWCVLYFPAIVPQKCSTTNAGHLSLFSIPHNVIYYYMDKLKISCDLYIYVSIILSYLLSFVHRKQTLVRIYFLVWTTLNDVLFRWVCFYNGTIRKADQRNIVLFSVIHTRFVRDHRKKPWIISKA